MASAKPLHGSRGKPRTTRKPKTKANKVEAGDAAEPVVERYLGYEVIEKGDGFVVVLNRRGNRVTHRV